MSTIVGYALANRVRDVVRAQGQDATLASVREVLSAEGANCSQETFDRQYCLAFPAARIARLGADVAGEDSRDRLSDFVRFAVAVEAAGGIARARRYLDMMEALGSELPERGDCTCRRG